MKIVTLATCHNRKEMTLRALRDLHAQVLPESVVVEHVLVDDGSTDGTADAVRDQYPDVEIVQGSGRLYWAGGMRYGWKKAVSRKVFDCLVVYNDDIRLFDYSIKRLLDTLEFGLRKYGEKLVIVGSFSDESGLILTYGGQMQSRWNPIKFERLPASSKIQEADTLNMNLALLTFSLVDSVGFLSDYFVHSGADFEYGLKAKAMGGQVLVCPGYVGICLRNEDEKSGFGRASTVIQRFRWLVSVKEMPLITRVRYARSYCGFLWPAFVLGPFVKSIFKR